MGKKDHFWMIFFLILAVFILNYSWLDYKITGFLSGEEQGVVTRIVDGDTIVIDNETVRLLGINTPEKGQKYYSEAKEFLEELILNQSVKTEKTKEDKDKYYRSLRYIFLDGENINKVLIESGYANPYFFEKDKYYDEFYEAWQICLSKGINLCEKSQDKCSQCILIKISENRKIMIFNQCGFECDLTGWTIKGEGRKYLEIKEKLNAYEESGINSEELSDVFSLFLRDEEGRLVYYWY